MRKDPNFEGTKSTRQLTLPQFPSRFFCYLQLADQLPTRFRPVSDQSTAVAPRSDHFSRPRDHHFSRPLHDFPCPWQVPSGGGGELVGKCLGAVQRQAMDVLGGEGYPGCWQSRGDRKKSRPDRLPPPNNLFKAVFFGRTGFGFFHPPPPSSRPRSTPARPLWVFVGIQSSWCFPGARSFRQTLLSRSRFCRPINKSRVLEEQRGAKQEPPCEPENPLKL